MQRHEDCERAHVAMDPQLAPPEAASKGEASTRAASKPLLTGLNIAMVSKGQERNTSRPHEEPCHKKLLGA